MSPSDAFVCKSSVCVAGWGDNVTLIQQNANITAKVALGLVFFFLSRLILSQLPGIVCFIEPLQLIKRCFRCVGYFFSAKCGNRLISAAGTKVGGTSDK